jgi:hypothetical protein
MKTFLQGVKRWYLRCFRGMGSVRKTPRTSWQEWASWRSTFFCKCGYLGEFTPDTYVIREQAHRENCEALMDIAIEEPEPLTVKQFTPPEMKTKIMRGLVAGKTCSCPVTDARYVKICPRCGMGNWKVAQ